MANPAAYPNGTKPAIKDGATHNTKLDRPTDDQKSTQHPRKNDATITSGKVR